VVERDLADLPIQALVDEPFRDRPLEIASPGRDQPLDRPVVFQETADHLVANAVGRACPRFEREIGGRVGANGLATIARGTVFCGPPFEGAESSSGFPIENPSREKVSLSLSRLAAVRARETLRSTPNDANTTEFRFPAWVPELVGATPLVRTQAFLLDQPVVFSEECQKKKPGTG
jgi:hypothetical protein